jgi:hypothetical protein
MLRDQQPGSAGTQISQIRRDYRQRGHDIATAQIGGSGAR